LNMNKVFNFATNEQPYSDNYVHLFLIKEKNNYKVDHNYFQLYVPWYIFLSLFVRRNAV